MAIETNKKNIAYASYFIRVYEQDNTNNVVIDTNKITQVLKSLQVDEYAFIKHDNDFENETKKPNHYHIWLKFNNKRGFDDVLEHFEKFLGVSHNAVNFEVCKNDNKAVQYLIHKNDSDKTRYDESLIISSLNKNALNAKLKPFDEMPFEEQIKYSPLMIAEYFGTDVYKKYGSTIKELRILRNEQDYLATENKVLKGILNDTLWMLDRAETLEDFLNIKNDLIKQLNKK